MKALTVRQPWAHLIVHGGKDVENRTRATRYRGLLAIHAARRRPSDDEIQRAWLIEKRSHEPGGVLFRPGEPSPIGSKSAERDYAFGAVLGTVEIVECIHAVDWDFSVGSVWAQPDRWHWILANPHPFEHPVPAKGGLSFWNWIESAAPRRAARSRT